VLDTHLEGREWIVGTSPTLADTACCGYLYYPEPFGFDRKAWPNISVWLDRISSLGGWKHPYDMMPRKAG
jgi:glutathione S-transferase